MYPKTNPEPRCSSPRYPRLDRRTTTAVATAANATTTAATFHPFADTAPLLLPPPPLLPSPLASPGNSLKKAVAPETAAAAASVADDAPATVGAPKLTSLLVRLMLRDARDNDRFGVRGPSSVSKAPFLFLAKSKEQRRAFI